MLISRQTSRADDETQHKTPSLVGWQYKIGARGREGGECNGRQNRYRVRKRVFLSCRTDLHFAPGHSNANNNQRRSQTLRPHLHEVVVLALIVHPNAVDVITIEVTPEDIRVRLEQ